MEPSKKSYVRACKFNVCGIHIHIDIIFFVNWN